MNVMSSIFESLPRPNLMINQELNNRKNIPGIGVASHFLKGFVYTLPLLDTSNTLIVEGNIAEVTGYSADEFLDSGLNVELLVADEDLTNYIQERKRIIENTSDEHTLKYRLKHKSVGLIQVAEKILVQYNSNGEAEFLIGYVEDKTIDLLNASTYDIPRSN